MSDLFTHITIPNGKVMLNYGEPMMILGSCFAETMGKKLEEGHFIVDLNPFGTLYNPASIATALRTLLNPERYTHDDIFQHEGAWHSFAHHSRFSSTDEQVFLGNINDRLFTSADFLRKSRKMIVTLGSAWVYKLKETGKIVSNCHKMPEDMFVREKLSVDDITSDWHNLLLSLWEQLPDLKILFTVSPVRHWKDGAHGNQLSKATLLLAIDNLQREFPEQIDYFPAYEIMMDELRDYRFYADDMLHPSDKAADIIWQRFIECSMSAETQDILKQWSDIKQALDHKPFQPESESYKKFMSQTMLKLERLNEKFPYFVDLLDKKHI